LAVLQVAPLWRFFAAGRDPQRARSGVAQWREEVRAALDGMPEVALAGCAEREDDLVSFDLDASGWTALRLWSLFAQRSELPWPDAVPAIPELDRSWREAADAGFPGSHFAQLQVPEVWLPGEFAFTAKIPLPDGVDAEIGAVGLAADQLTRLNRLTFDAAAEDVAAWQQIGAPAGVAFLDGVRRGMAAATAAFALARASGLSVRVVQPG